VLYARLSWNAASTRPGRAPLREHFNVQTIYCLSGFGSFHFASPIRIAIGFLTGQFLKEQTRAAPKPRVAEDGLQ
jgi:hypothetical protein